MPELPEVETIRSQLAKSIIGLQIKELEVRRNEIITGVRSRIIGKKIIKLRRFSKLLILDLEGDISLAIHLKMTGQLIFVPVISSTHQSHMHWDKDYLTDKHTHVSISFSTNEKLLFNDQRRFGYIHIIQSSEVPHLTYIKNLGFEFLSNLSLDQFKRLLSKYRQPIKQLLLDQTKMAGVGNIYACESLWESRIDPRTKSCDISVSNQTVLFHAIESILHEAIARHGASRQNFRDIYGQKGQVQNYFHVYEKKGEPCMRCGMTITKITIAGRGTYMCPTCQQ